ncbi:hypothetical protein HY639_01180 [Candidatus Woesearchaeota archaeon]|nr:hypothetical protein [Candidatus Woesearchaeota archaeon]
MKPGTPIPFQKAVNGNLENALRQHKGRTQADIKYNGQRTEVHIMPGQGPCFFSKNFVELNPRCFPELLPDLERYRIATIFDAEIVGTAGGAEGLVAIQRRPKKNPDHAKVAEYPIQLRVFDVLYYGQSMLDASLDERRGLLEKIVVGKNVLAAESRHISTQQDLVAFYMDVVHTRKEEGLVAKDRTAPYLAGKESKTWLKLKEFETLDLVVGGVYNNPFNAVLLCAYNDATGTYETVVKVGVTGELQQEIATSIGSQLTNSPPPNIVFNPKLQKKTYQRKIPTAYVNPDKSIVVTVKAQDISYNDNWHSCGGLDKAYSLLIPVITHIREPTDKGPRDATRPAQIAELFAAQHF